MSLFSRFRQKDRAGDGRFGYAVVGLGHIAKYFVEALADSPTCAVRAVVSGDRAKADTWARKYGARSSGTYAEFEAVCGQPGVDAVYLALPVSLHREWTERAAAASKHVLCEKPMAATPEEARGMIAACSAASVLLSVAYRCPHMPLHQRARLLVQDGALGGDLRIESGFGFKLAAGWRDSAALGGGGSLYDVGIYPLNAARFLLREEPSGVVDAVARCDADGLERAIEWTSVFPSGARAVCRSSYEEEIADTLRISGDAGTLLLDPAFSHRARVRLRGEYRDATTQRLVRIDERAAARTPSSFRLEAEQLAAAVRGDAPLLTPGEDGLADMVAMGAIYTAAGVPLA